MFFYISLKLLLVCYQEHLHMHAFGEYGFTLICEIEDYYSLNTPSICILFSSSISTS